jgi:HlyD family secretion protein
MNKQKLSDFLKKVRSGLQQKRTIAILLGVIALIVVVAVAGCARQAAQNEAAAAAVTPVIASTSVIAEGHLEPLMSTWLSFQTTGRVEAVLVLEGDSIRKGQALVRLEGSDRAQAELTAAQSANFLAQQNLDDAKKSDSAKAAAELALAQAQRAYNEALGDFWTRNDPQGSEEQIALYEAKVTVAEDRVERAQKRYDRMAEQTDDDPKKAQAKADLEQAKIDLQNLKDLRDYYADAPDAIDQSIFAAKLSVAKAALEDAQREYDKVRNGPSPESLAAVQAAADAAQAAEDKAQWAYDQLVLKAPYDGTFVRCDLTVGQFITVGQQAALVADLSAWRIETDDLDENDVTLIDASQPVKLTADALPGLEFSGSVDCISQYSTNDNGDVLYTVKIKLVNDEPQLRWGMTMEVEFVPLPGQ